MLNLTGLVLQNIELYSWIVQFTPKSLALIALLVSKKNLIFSLLYEVYKLHFILMNLDMVGESGRGVGNQPLLRGG